MDQQVREEEKGKQIFKENEIQSQAVEYHLVTP
jgi:hypothetical protein